MLNEIFYQNSSFITNYFEKKLENHIISQGSFPQSIIFETSDIWQGLFLSLELARILNCEKNRDNNCKCTNCSWIKTFSHPAITLVSPINFKEMDKGSASVISTTQCVAVSKKLEETSSYHRIFIFLDAKQESLSELEKSRLEKYSNLNYQIPEDWTPLPLNHKIFQDRASNVILKSVEEPPKNTTFIFLTNARENIIQTIVSRSQVFKLPQFKDKSESTYINSLFKNYPNITLEESFEISSKLQNYIKENSITTKDLITMLTNYFSNILKNSTIDRNTIKILKKDIQSIYRMEKMLYSTVQLKTALDWFLVEISHIQRV